MKTAESTEVRFHLDQGLVKLTCGDVAFDRLCVMIMDTAGPIDGATVAVRCIQIERVPPPPPPFRWWHPLPMLGCAVVGFVILFVLVAGIGTLAGWVR